MQTLYGGLKRYKSGNFSPREKSLYKAIENY